MNSSQKGLPCKAEWSKIATYEMLQFIPSFVYRVDYFFKQELIKQLCLVALKIEVGTDEDECGLLLKSDEEFSYHVANARNNIR